MYDEHMHHTYIVYKLVSPLVSILTTMKPKLIAVVVFDTVLNIKHFGVFPNTK